MKAEPACAAPHTHTHAMVKASLPLFWLWANPMLNETIIKLPTFFKATGVFVSRIRMQIRMGTVDPDQGV